MVLEEKGRFLSWLVAVMGARGCYADALYVAERRLTITRDDKTTEAGAGEDEGVKLRLFDGASWHEHGVTGWDEHALMRIARRLARVERRGQRSPPAPGEEAPARASYAALGTTDPASVPARRKAADLRRLHEELHALGSFVNVKASYDETREVKLFVSADRRLCQEISGCHLSLAPFVKAEDGTLRYHYKSWFGHGYEAVMVPRRELRRVALFAERVARAERLPPGQYHCLLSPAVAGLLAHESFGHGMEADTIAQGRARAREWISKRIAPPLVTISDDPLRPGAHGFYFFDDEGVLATRTVMVEKGVVRSPLTSAQSALALGARRTSNGRAASYDRKVYARMSNTFFEPGRSSKEALLRRMKRGLILHDGSGGMEDPKGWGIQVHGITAEEVREGRPTGRLYYEVGMSGYLPDILKRVVGVSREFSLPGTGWCGKGHHDWVRVAEGGPWLLIKDVMLS